MKKLDPAKCPLDQSQITVAIDCLPVNNAILLVTGSVPVDQFTDFSALIGAENVDVYLATVECFENLAGYSNLCVKGNDHSYSTPCLYFYPHKIRCDTMFICINFRQTCSKKC